MKYAAILAMTFALLMTPAPQARAAPCQDGAATTLDGIVKSITVYDVGTWMLVETPAQDDCRYVYVVAKDARTCPLGSPIHAAGTLARHDPSDVYAGWILTDPGAKPLSGKLKARGYNSAFSCTQDKP